MRIAAHIQSEAPSDEDRRSQRRAVSVRAGFRKRGYDQAKADVRDLSAKGFKVDSAMTLGVGTEVWLTLPGMSPQPAIVKWVKDFVAGCEFVDPLHEAIFDDFVRRNGG